MGTVRQSTVATATAYGNQRKIDRTSNGVLWQISGQSNDDPYLSYSTDGGTTWTAAGQLNGVGSGQNYTWSGSLHIDSSADGGDRAFVVVKDRGNGFLYFYFGTPSNAARTSYTWSAVTLIENQNVNYDLPDLVAHREGSGWVAHIVYTITGNQQPKAYYVPVTLSSSGAAAVGGRTVLGLSPAANSNPGYPSIDFNHSGDGKTVAGGTPHLYVGWSAGATGTGYGIRFRKATYSAGSWTWGTEREIDSTRYVSNAARWLNCLFDGTRVIMGGWLTYSGGDVQTIYERDAADTASLEKFGSGASTDSLLYGSMSYDAQGNVYMFGRGSSGGQAMAYRKWTRAASAYGPQVIIDNTNIDNVNASARRGSAGNAIDYVYTDGTASPYTVTSGRIALNAAPTAATPTTPTTGSSVDRTTAITLAWVFNDPDAGDSQSKSDIRYKLTSASTWTTILGATTTATSYALPAGQAAGNYEWQVLTYDALGVASPWSSSSFFTAADPPGTPVITAPANGGTIATASYTVTWSAPQQDAYEVRRVADNAGSPNTGTVYSTTGVVEDTTSRARTLAFETNNRTEHVQVRVRYSGIWSQWASARALVSYTRPPTPVAVLTPDNTIAAMNIAITNPTPSGSQPAVLANQIYVDNGDGLGSILLVDGQVPNSTFVYRLAVPFFDYSLNKVKVVAVGANGTTAEAFAT